jgi:hypothetical protein
MVKKQSHASVPLSTCGLLSQSVKLFVIGMGSAEQYQFESTSYWSALKGNILERPSLATYLYKYVNKYKVLLKCKY